MRPRSVLVELNKFRSGEELVFTAGVFRRRLQGALAVPMANLALWFRVPSSLQLMLTVECFCRARPSGTSSCRVLLLVRCVCGMLLKWGGVLVRRVCGAGEGGRR